ncbi:hypothetical protein JMJ56_27980 [Belnapia sp. T18]|uniref:HTH psq-type domain-containing protein n=1 Tax=Belnapia arida TaxID=2804533 RepID=A0ABS1UAW5_9PROT|nr:hypothetical protein [Belnapia arida]MBL6081828.1 hypothetical protein [Belnapia arida]
MRAEWELGLRSNRALGNKYGITEAAVRKRAANPKQPGGAWVRGAPAVGPVREQAARPTTALMACAPEPLPPPHNPTVSRIRAAPGEETAQGAMRIPGLADTPSAAEVQPQAKVRKELLKLAAETLAEHNRRHLAELDRAMQVLKRTGELLEQALQPRLTPHDAAQAKEALDQLLPGRGDSLTTVIAEYARGLSTVQDQMRKALGVEDRPRKPAQSGSAGAPAMPVAQTFLNYNAMPTKVLIGLLDAIRYVDGQNDELPPPMPPPNPARNQPLVALKAAGYQ